jgi:pterin-4a-carbinolamine dehydratase
MEALEFFDQEVDMNKQDQGFEVLMAQGAGKLRRPPRPRGKLKPERVEEELRTMPGWKLAADGRALEHAREFAQPAAAARFTAFVAELAASQRQPVQVGISGNWVLLTLHRRKRAGGLTMPVIDFARQIS